MPRFITILLLFLLLCCGAQAGQAEKNCSLQLFFGLSRPDGGTVSEQQWQTFRDQVLATTFEGFTEYEATGWYKGQSERTKVVVIIATEPDAPRARDVAARFAERFHQESVMLVTTPLGSWDFIGPGGKVP